MPAAATAVERNGATPSSRLAVELRLAGRPTFVIPPLLAVFSAIVIVLLEVSKNPVRLFAASVVEGVLPLGAAVAVTMLLGSDNALELQLSLPSDYRRTLMARAVPALVWSAAVSFVTATIIEVTGTWQPGIIRAEGAWIVATAVLVAIGLLGAAISGDGRIGAAVVGAVWIFEEGLKSWFLKTGILHPLFIFATSRFEPRVTNWWVNRFVLLVIAALFATAAWRLLARPNRLVRGSR